MRKVFSLKTLKIFIITSIIIVVIFYINNIIISTIINIAKNNVEAQNEEIVMKVFSDNDFGKNRYGEFYKISRNTDGKITSFETNSFAINEFSASFTDMVRQAINRNTIKYAEVPLGSLLTFKILYAGFGDVKIKMKPLNVVSCEFKSFFENKGINQTRHCVFLSVKIKTALSIPAKYTEIVNECDFILFDVIIVGDVPDFYLESSSNT